jgi:hypothetical protein
LVADGNQVSGAVYDEAQKMENSIYYYKRLPLVAAECVSVLDKIIMHPAGGGYRCLASSIWQENSI